MGREAPILAETVQRAHEITTGVKTTHKSRKPTKTKSTPIAICYSGCEAKTEHHEHIARFTDEELDFIVTAVASNVNKRLDEMIQRLENNGIALTPQSDHEEFNGFDKEIKSYIEDSPILQSGEMKNTESSNSGIGATPELIESNTTSAPPQEQVEVTQFMDDKAGINVDIGADIAYTVGDESQAVNVEAFLKRPVLIRTIDWADGASINTPVEFFPWADYFNDPVVKRKLDNYFLLKCNLRMKVILNASPFYYGAGIFAYQPLYEFEQNFDFATNPNYLDRIFLSQKPHLYVYPQNSQGGEMTLPFVYHKEWLDCTSLTDMQNMGRMAFRSFGSLQNANGIVGAGVTIQVYAWAEDVLLAGPTRRLALQSGDEYSDNGVVSKPASAIARAAGELEDVPIIGPFATATKMVSSVVGGIASLFGFTRVPVIDDVVAYQQKTHPNLAATDIGAPIEKLTIDAKNELSIDPKICGVALSDEMNISSFVMRESYVSTTVWSTSDVAGTVLNTWLVNPGYAQSESQTGQRFMKFFPMSYVARLFEFWRGDIIFRFKIICSQYHRGRLQFYWDPIQQFNAAIDPTQTNYTKIVDITENTDIEIRIPYTQATAYLFAAKDESIIWESSTPRIPVAGTDNGVFGMRVLTRQTSPVASADIQVLTFIRGADNLEFSCPDQPSNRYSPYEIQSGEMDINKTETCIGIKPSQPQKEINLVYMGETITSFRQLFNRAVRLLRVDSATPIGNVNNRVRTQMRAPRLNIMPGFDPNGLHNANNVNDASTSKFNFCTWTSQSWMSLAFIGTRGAVTYWINPLSNSVEDPESMEIHRVRSDEVKEINFFTLDTTTAPYDAAARDVYARRQNGIRGMAMTNCHTMTGLSASIPMYSQFKFVTNNPDDRTQGVSYDASDDDAVLFQIEVDRFTPNANDPFPGFDIYTCAGADFSLIFFSGVQPMYLYDTFPTAST